MCVALYSGYFSIDVISDILNRSALQVYNKEFEFLLDNQYIEIEYDVCTLTSKGFKAYGAVASLFWSNEHKNKYIKEKCDL